MHLNNLILMYKPMKLALEQLGMVGVKYTMTILFWLSIYMSWRFTTFSCSRERGCSGSGRWRIYSKTSS